MLEGCHKIGRSKSPEDRVKTLAETPCELTVRHRISTANMVWLESYLHAAFSHRRVKGEWFRLNDAELAVITSVAVADGPADIPPAMSAFRDAKLWVGRRPTPGRTLIAVNVDAVLLDRFKAFAKVQGETLRSHIETAIRRHLDNPPPLPPVPPPAAPPKPRGRKQK